MKCRILLVFCLCVWTSASWSESPRKNNSEHRTAPAEWTIMLYMNGRNNNLETAALCDFHEMLEASFSRAISLVVELSLDGKQTGQNGMTSVPCPDMVDVPYWSGTRRFVIENKVTGHKAKPHTEDLGDPKALKEFVKWARKHYPSRHYMLDLWSHGDAIPRLLAAGPPAMDAQKQFITTKDKIDKLHAQNDGGAISMYKSGDSHILLNS